MNINVAYLWTLHKSPLKSVMIMQKQARQIESDNPAGASLCWQEACQPGISGFISAYPAFILDFLRFNRRIP